MCCEFVPLTCPLCTVDHDEFCGSATGFTYSVFDGVSGVLDPKTKAVKAKLGNLCLITQHHEMQMASIVREAGGEMTFNGAPRTRTWRQFAQQGGAAGGPRGALLHEDENSEENRMMFLHLHSPIGLLRYGGAHNDINPKYNATCAANRIGPSLNMSACVGRNIGDHLDYGVAPYLCEHCLSLCRCGSALSDALRVDPDDGLWAKGGGVNVMQILYPLDSPITIGAGVMEGSNKLYTNHSVTDYSPRAAEPSFQPL
eukprot:COSAG01_NODE_20012_length_976_cov_1.166477_1_plen_255_part_10